MTRQVDDPTLCYLCGLSIGRTHPTMDHVPPGRFFPSAVRASLGKPLLTLKAHPNCHKPWGKDEEYFFNTLLRGVLNGPLGADLAKDFRASLKHDGSRRLAEAVLRQFEEKPSGLVLPPGRLIQRLDGTRLARVVWKIVRGLYFAERGVVLPEETPRRIEIYGPQDPQAPGIVLAVMGETSRGLFPSVLDYKVMTDDAVAAEFWDLLFWDRHVAFVAFHDPLRCTCTDCRRLFTA
jgi:hypothetical protein